MCVPQDHHAVHRVNRIQRINELPNRVDRDTLRTWFYLDDSLDWYGDFNRWRDELFRREKVFEKRVPASTGIGAANAEGSAILAGLLAVTFKDSQASARTVPSPLQCSALDYGSSFSRALELDCSGRRTRRRAPRMCGWPSISRAAISI